MTPISIIILLSTYHLYEPHWLVERIHLRVTGLKGHGSRVSTELRHGRSVGGKIKLRGI